MSKAKNAMRRSAYRDRIIYRKYPEPPKAILPLTGGAATLVFPFRPSPEDFLRFKAWMLVMIDIVEKNVERDAP
jgi:hypothetical protein